MSGAAGRRWRICSRVACFNAARGFVGGAAVNGKFGYDYIYGFNAARGFVGGAAPIEVWKELETTVAMPHAAL